MSEAFKGNNINMASHCNCKSSCSTKRKENGTRGCPCKGNNTKCSADCQCGTRAKPCNNRAMAENSDRDREDRGRSRAAGGTRVSTSQGFRLSHNQVESEESQREKEHKDVKDFIATLDDSMVRKLAIRGLRRGIGSMDYIETLLIMEDDLNENEDVGVFRQSSTDQLDDEPPTQDSSTQDPGIVQNPTTGSVPDWCDCGKCQPMTQGIENKCCKLKKCITLSSRFSKLCLDPDVLELCIRNTGDIRNDREDNSTRAFRKAAYRQFILARHGHLGKGNRRVCPSCVVLKIRERFPSITA